MHSILIEDIEKEPNKTLNYSFDGYMQEFNCNIKADLKLKSLGDFIEVCGSANGKLKLICDRCLSEFDYDLNIQIKEIYAKQSLENEYPQEFELKGEQFVIDLNGEKEINIYDLLYQSVILSLPNKKVCGINCNEGMFASQNEISPHDDRMDIFKSIKIEKK